MCVSLEKSNPEVQRATAEVWASVLRRLKETDRQRCIGLMIKSSKEAKSDSLIDVTTWSIVFACKVSFGKHASILVICDRLLLQGVAQTLHSTASSVVVACVDCHLTLGSDYHEVTKKLLRRVLTALIHHCQKPEQFGTVADPLIEKFVSSAECNDMDKLEGLLFTVGIPCATRGGSRLTSELKCYAM